jgi:hypothetical protein
MVMVMVMVMSILSQYYFFAPATRFRSTVAGRVLFISLQKHKEMLCTKVNMSVMLLACFVTQTKHVYFNVSFVPIKLYSCYLCDIKLVSLHNAVKFLIFHSRFIFTFPHNKRSRNYVLNFFYNFPDFVFPR